MVGEQSGALLLDFAFSLWNMSDINLMLLTHTRSSADDLERGNVHLTFTGVCHVCLMYLGLVGHESWAIGCNKQRQNGDKEKRFGFLHVFYVCRYYRDVSY